MARAGLASAPQGKMATNLYRPTWDDLDAGELRFILLECIGKPGQYDGLPEDANTFYLPLARDECQIKLTFSPGKQIVAIEPGPAFDAERWAQFVREVERTSPRMVGRDWSFSSFRVNGSWRGHRSGVQILPAPTTAPAAPVEMAEHPFILEFPLVVSDNFAITNFRRRREHRQLTLILNLLLAGRTTYPVRQSRHLWAVDGGESTKWVQESYFADLGAIVREDLPPPSSEALEEVEPDAYYATVGHDGKGLRVPADLDDAICCYMSLWKGRVTREKLRIATFWMDMAARHWTLSQSASFASLAIAVEALGERTSRPTDRFRNFIERYAPGSKPEARTNMYALRSDILHGSGLMERDKDAAFGWAPPEKVEGDLLDELWSLTRTAMRNWIKSATPA
jgi:hypothetical protein